MGKYNTEYSSGAKVSRTARKSIMWDLCKVALAKAIARTNNEYDYNIDHYCRNDSLIAVDIRL